MKLFYLILTAGLLCLAAQTVFAYENCEACRADHQTVCADECMSDQDKNTDAQICHKNCLESKCRTDCAPKNQAAPATPAPKSEGK